MNIVNMAMKYVGPMVAERIAAKLGIGGPLANKLIAAALPMILGSVMGKSKSSSGLSTIMDMVTGANKPDGGALSTAFDAGGDVDGLVKSGGGMLEGLFGGESVKSMSGALGNYAGVDADTAGSIMGMLAPAALGSVSNVVAEQGLDGGGLAAFFNDQTGNVAQAMPAGLASNLSGTGLIDGLQDKMGAATSAVQSVQADVKSSGSKLPLIIGAAAIALLAWNFLGRDKAPEMPDVSSAVEMGQDFMVGDVNIGEQFGSITGSLTDTFTGITDGASASAALPQLTDLTGQIGSLSETAGQLSGTAKTGFQGIVGTALGQLRPLIEGAVASSGAGAILQPVVDQLLGALEGMAG